MAGIDDRVIGRDAFKEASSCPVGHLLVDIEHAVPSGLSDLGRVDEGVAHQDGMLSFAGDGHAHMPRRMPRRMDHRYPWSQVPIFGKQFESSKTLQWGDVGPNVVKRKVRLHLSRVESLPVGLMHDIAGARERELALAVLLQQIQPTWSGCRWVRKTICTSWG